MPETSTISIPKDVLEPIIQAHVTAAIATALGDRSRLVEQCVAHALTKKVDEKGVVNQQDYYNKTEFLRWLVDDAIRTAATNAVREHIAGDIEAVKLAVAKEMKNQKSAMTKELLAGIAKAAVSMSRFQIAVTVNHSNR